MGLVSLFIKKPIFNKINYFYTHPELENLCSYKPHQPCIW